DQPPAPEPDAGSSDPAHRPELVIRPAGRVVLLDPDNRVLMMRYDDGPPNGVHWSTPGGGLDPGEDYATAAARELAEETGWHDIELGGEIHHWTHTMEYDDAIVRQVERFFVARTDLPEPGITGVGAMHEADGTVTWNWWPLEEPDAPDEALWPAELPELIRKTRALPGRHLLIRKALAGSGRLRPDHPHQGTQPGQQLLLIA